MSDDRRDEHEMARLRTEREVRSGVTQGVGSVIAFPNKGVRVPLDRAAWFLSYHGLVVGQSVCDQCGHTVQVTDSQRCPECLKPYPYRCHGVAVPWDVPGVAVQPKKCMTMLHARPYRITTPKGAVLTAWDDTERVCDECVRESRRTTRARDWVLSFGRSGGGPERVRAVRDELLPFILNYDTLDGRTELDLWMSRFVHGEGPVSYFVWGGVGTGKTIGVNNASYHAYVTTQTVHSVLSVEQGDLIRAFRAQYGDVERERREEAAELIASLQRVDLLVVDEMFSFIDVKNQWSPTAAADLGDAFRFRFAHKKKTLFISNQNPQMGGDLKASLWTKLFDERLADRAMSSCKVIHVRGQSLRAPVPHTLPLPFGDKT